MKFLDRKMLEVKIKKHQANLTYLSQFLIESVPKIQISEENEEEVLPNADKTETSSGSNVNYRKNIMEMFARNFYKLKYSALVLAFMINFLMLFFKAIQVASEGSGETGGDDENTDIANIEDKIEFRTRKGI